MSPDKKWWIVPSALAGLAVATNLGAMVIGASGSPSNLPKELDDFTRNRMKIVVHDPNVGDRTIIPFATDETLVMEVAGIPNDWCNEMCQVGFSDRGTPYDRRGHGEVTLRLWWGISPNKENFTGNMWFAELWFGGAWGKSWWVLDSKRGWLEILHYGPDQNWVLKARYLEIHPDGHIMNP